MIDLNDPRELMESRHGHCYVQSCSCALHEGCQPLVYRPQLTKGRVFHRLPGCLSFGANFKATLATACMASAFIMANYGRISGLIKGSWTLKVKNVNL